MKNKSLPWIGAWVIGVLSLAVRAQSPPPLRIELGTGIQLHLSWADPDGSSVLEESDTLITWRPFPESPILVNGEFSVTVNVSNVPKFFRLRGNQVGELPPDPASIATPLPSGVASRVGETTAFLYSGPNPVQSRMPPGTIQMERAAVVRGKVWDRNRAPLSGVVVSVLGHPELGQTLSRADGMFDLAVNGGAEVTLKYDKTDYCSIQRQVNVPWQEFVLAPEVVLMRMDPIVTPIALGENSPMQVHQASMQTDADGVRRATLIFKPGTCGSLVLADGTEQECNSISVRATEFTVGADGPNAMPGALPPSSGFTYCVELSADEAVVAGATEVKFSAPVPLYVENFLGFPVGSLVPTGYYDRVQGRWVASENGRVVKILRIMNSLAELDLDGDDLIDDESALGALGIGEDERMRLAMLYPVGQEIWRSLIPHFTPWDCNWPYGPPPGALPPSASGNPRPGPKPDKPLKDGPNKNCGSIIGAESQALGEVIKLTGVPASLHFQSDRMPGYRDSYSFNVRLSGDTLPQDLQRIHLEVSTAGQVFMREYAPQSNLVDTFTWDGKDAYGRFVNGETRARVRIGYEYIAQYYATSDSLNASFNRFGTPPIATGRGGGGGGGGGGGVVSFSRLPMRMLARPLILWQEYEAPVGVLRTPGLGGWSLNVHHAYDVAGQTLHLGNGDQRSSAATGDVISTIAGTSSGYSGDGGPAAKAQLDCRDLSVGADGSVYFADQDHHRVRRILPSGLITTVAGLNYPGFDGDGGPATQAALRGPRDVAVASDGSLYIADVGNHCVRRVGPDGRITTVAGAGTLAGFAGDGGPAATARLAGPSNVAVAADGSLFISDTFNHRIRRVGTDGVIATVAGSGEPTGTGGDGGLATQAPIREPRGIAVARDGNLYIADQYTHRIRRVGPDGIIATVVGIASASGSSGDGVAATQARLNYPMDVALGTDGSLYIADQANRRIRRVNPEGIITTLAGTGGLGFAGDGGAATQAVLNWPEGIAAGADGNLYIADTFNYRIRKVAPGLSGTNIGDISIAAEDGSEVYIFNASGRHLRTIDALTGALRFAFAYDDTGHLTSLTDGSSQVTIIERDGGGAPLAIVAPFGQRTTLVAQGDGYLARVINPAGEIVQLTYNGGTGQGLLATMTDPRGNEHRYLYDTRGRLVRDEDPAGGFKTLVRTDIAEGHFAVTITTGLGIATRYEVEELSTGETRRVRTDPGGARTELLIQASGSRQVKYADGTLVTLTDGPDPRFGMQAPITKNLVLTRPGGTTATRSATRTAILSDPVDPLSVISLTDTLTLNGQTYTSTYTAATRTLITTTPAGRQSTATYDPQGRVVEAQWDAVSALEAERHVYAPSGFLTRISEGAQSWDYAYDSNGRLLSRTDAAGSSIAFAYNAADHRTRVTLPSGAAYGFEYDAQSQCCASENRTRVTMPSLDVHSLEYTANSQESSYTPPGNSPYVTTYDIDGRVTLVTMPTGRTQTFTYDGGSRLTGIRYSEASVLLEHAPGNPAARVNRLTRTPAGGAPAQVTTSVYDGGLVTNLTSSGSAAGTYTYTYDTSLQLKSVAFNSGTDTAATALTRDADGLLTELGPFSFSRTGPAGTTSQISDGTLTILIEHDTLRRITRRTHSVAGQQRYALQLGYDAVGRIATRAESVAGASRTQSYDYDTDGQLAEVRQDGLVVERYTYNPNRNRVTRQVGNNPVETSSHDSQDRLVQRGLQVHQFNADGFLTQRGTDSFQYSTAGELLQAVVDGQMVTYMYDGLRRRVSRTDSAGTTEYFYGHPDNDLQVSHSRDPAGVLTTYYYYDNGPSAFAMRRGSALFYVGADQLGSPRLVCDATGTVVKSVDYDAFGAVEHDSNPGFDLPIGFAGGLTDSVTDLVRFGWRDYDPSSGRWTARDPALFDSDQTNLYAYCHNNPVNSIDFVGLGSVGFYAYDGIGTGLKLGWTENGISACLEVGFGTKGASFEIDPSADLDANGVSLDGKVGLKGGIFKVGAGLEIGECANFKPKAEACVGPFCSKAGSGGLKARSSYDPEENAVEPFKSDNVGFSGKIAAKLCQQARW